MAKFELSVYDAKTGDVEKVCKRNFMPVSLYIRFQQLSEKVVANKIGSDSDLFNALKPLFLETFPELTEDDYTSGTDVAEVLVMFRDIIDKSTQIGGNSKNG